MINFLMKHLKFSLTAVILLTVGMIVALATLFSTPAPKSDKPEDLAAFIASPGFRKLPDAKQEEYLKRMRPSREKRGNPREITAAMTETQRRAMFENIRALHEKKMIEELKAYFKMSKAEKERYLDQKIAEQDQRMAEFARRRAERSAAEKKDGEAQERRRPSPDQMAAMMKNRIETTAPEVRAARQKFFQDLMKRRAATGRTLARNGPPPRH